MKIKPTGERFDFHPFLKSANSRNKVEVELHNRVIAGCMKYEAKRSSFIQWSQRRKNKPTKGRFVFMSERAKSA